MAVSTGLVIRHLPLALVLMVTSALTPAVAQDSAQVVDVDSVITAVTVYRDGADIVRVADISLGQGANVLVLDDLTAELISDSVRIEAAGTSGLEIGGIDLTMIAVAGEGLDDSARARIEAEIEGLRDQIAIADDTIAAAELQIAYLQNLAGVPPWLRGDASGNDTEARLDPDDVFAFLGREIAPLLQTVRASEIEQRGLRREIDNLERQLKGEPSETLYRTRLGIDVATVDAFEGTVEIRYRVAAASWTPFYDLRLDTEGDVARVDLVRRAEIVQATGEAWTDVAMTLATSQPGGATEAPEPGPVYVDIERPRPERSQQQMLDAEVRSAPMAETAIAAIESGVDVIDTGFDAVYVLPGQVTVAETGDPRRIMINRQTIDAELTVRTAPAIDLAAYLSAEVTLEDGGAVLPGQASLFRNGVFVGETYLDLIAPGEISILGFGADDLVTVERIPVQDRRGERGLFSTSSTDLKDWTLRVTNRHETAIDVVVLDRLPQARDERIEIELLETNTQPTTTDVDDVAGLLAWEDQLQPGDIMDVRFGYELRWPEGQDVTYREW